MFMYFEIAKEIFKQNNTSKADYTQPNIFEILQIENKEVLFCRFLGYILKPESKLNNGNIYPVKTFIQKVLLSVPNEEIDQCEDFKVELEETIDSSRRVDIVIYAGKNKVFPLEVKINAGDQPSQLYDYYNFYFNQTQYTYPKQIYYLTLTGKNPSEYSISRNINGNKHKLKSTNYKAISYSDDRFKQWMESISYNDKISNFLREQFIREIEIMSNSQKERDAIYKSLGIENEDFEKIKNNSGFLFAIINNEKDIKKKIQQIALKKRIKGIDQDKYELYEPNENDNKKDKYCVLGIVDKNTEVTVAWLAIETNLYIITEKLKNGVNIKPGGNGEEWSSSTSVDNYYWRFIGPNGNESYSMGGSYIANCFEDDSIDIKEIFEQIDF